MNQCIVDLFNDPQKVTKLKHGLPVAFEMAGLELPSGNPAVGFLREHAITGFFVYLFGADRVQLPEHGNARGFDIVVCDEPLSIKTVTSNGSVKLIWTVDTSSISKEIGGKYSPDCDMLLTRIYWNENKPSIFYIPLAVQEEVFTTLGVTKYLTAAIGTNHRGISIRAPAMTELMNHTKTMRLSVNWVKSGLDYTPYKRWEKFWENQ